MNKANTKVVFSTTVITPALRRALKSNTRPTWHVALSHNNLVETVTIHPITSGCCTGKPGFFYEVDLFWSPHKRAWFGRSRVYNEAADFVEREEIYSLTVADAVYYGNLVQLGQANLFCLIPRS